MENVTFKKNKGQKQCWVYVLWHFHTCFSFALFIFLLWQLYNLAFLILFVKHIISKTIHTMYKLILRRMRPVMKGRPVRYFHTSIQGEYLKPLIDGMEDACGQCKWIGTIYIIVLADTIFIIVLPHTSFSWTSHLSQIIASYELYMNIMVDHISTGKLFPFLVIQYHFNSSSFSYCIHCHPLQCVHYLIYLWFLKYYYEITNE